MECNLPRLEIKKRFGFVKGGKGGENREGGREREREAGRAKPNTHIDTHTQKERERERKKEKIRTDREK